MHIVKKDKKKLLILAVLAIAAAVLMIIGDGVAVGKQSMAATSESAASPQGDDYFAATEAELAEALSKIEGKRRRGGADQLGRGHQRKICL